MRAFRVLVHGVLTPAPSPGGPLPRGFYTAREVAAATREAAALAALRLVQQDPRVGEIMAQWQSAAPALLIDEIVAMEADEEFDPAPRGFILYDESEEPDDAPADPE